MERADLDVCKCCGTCREWMEEKPKMINQCKYRAIDTHYANICGQYKRSAIATANIKVGDLNEQNNG